MRFQAWMLAIAALPTALWPAPVKTTALKTPRQLYRAAQALEYNDQLQQAQALYAQVASAIEPDHPLADDVATARRLLREKLRDRGAIMPCSPAEGASSPGC